MNDNDYDSALKHYNSALRWLKMTFDEMIITKETEAEKLVKEIGVKMKLWQVPCHLNIAICYANKEEWKEVIYYTTKVLEIDDKNKQALYYRILAYQNQMEVMQ